MVDVGFTHLRLPRDLETARTSGNFGPMEGISREKQVVLDAAKLKISKIRRLMKKVCESSRVAKKLSPVPKQTDIVSVASNPNLQTNLYAVQLSLKGRVCSVLGPSKYHVRSTGGIIWRTKTLTDPPTPKFFIERNAPNTFQNKSEWFIGAMSITKPKSGPGDPCFDPFVSAEDKNQNVSSVMLPLEEFYPNDWNILCLENPTAKQAHCKEV